MWLTILAERHASSPAPPKTPGLSFARLLRENAGLEAVAANFVYVKGQKSPPHKGRRKVRRG